MIPYLRRFDVVFQVSFVEFDHPFDVLAVMGCKFIVTPQAFRTKSYLKTIFFEVHRICQVVPILDIKCLHVGGVGQEEDQEAGGRVAADDEEDESGESEAY